MIAGFADGGRVLGEPRYVEAAQRAADFVLTALRGEDGGLLRAYRAGQARVGAFLEDYALVIRGLLALEKATGQRKWLDEASLLARAARQRFWDPRFGGYFDTAAGGADLFVRARSVSDGALPCGNSVMLDDLLDLYELTGRGEYLDEAAATLSGISAAIAQSPLNSAVTTLALHRFVRDHPQALPGGGAARPDGSAAVRITCDVERLALPPEGAAHLDLTLRIAPGYHINAHEPGLPELTGLTVYLVGGHGLAADAEYPQGELYEGEIRVHRGSITVPVALRRTGPWDGQAKLAVVFQACSDRACLAPTTTTVPVEIVSRIPQLP